MTDQLNERIYICVDDTDDLTKATSTGAIAEEIGRRVCARFGCAINMGITRHQLLLDERVPYTSHNSSMCFDVTLPAGSAAAVDELGWEVIRSMRAGSANPGLCIFPVRAEEAKDGCGQPDRDGCENVIRFGLRAKEEFIQLEEACRVALLHPEMILKSEGESGQGMIGALAGVGLRITGGDGRFRGKYDLSNLANESCTVGQLTDAFTKRYGFPPAFLDQEENLIDPLAEILPVTTAKAVLRGGRLTFICGKEDQGIWKPHSKDEFNNKRKKKDACERFVADPDREERFHEKQKPTCGSCLYRRLTADGYFCVAGQTPDGDGRKG